MFKVLEAIYVIFQLLTLNVYSYTLFRAFLYIIVACIAKLWKKENYALDSVTVAISQQC